MLVIRLTRKGKKNQPFFRVVVTDKRRSAKGGRAVEILGYVDPLTKRKSLKKERILHWLKVGAKASPTVHNLLVSEKVIEAAKISKHKKLKKVAVPVVAPVATGAQPVKEEVAPVAKTQSPAAIENTKVEEEPVETPKEEPKV